LRIGPVRHERAGALRVDVRGLKSGEHARPVPGPTRREGGTPAACGRAGIGPAPAGPQNPWRSVMTKTTTPARVALSAIEVGENVRELDEHTWRRWRVRLRCAD
jgi:hypothetical protein